MLFGFTADRFRFISAAAALRLFRWNGLRFAETTTAVFDAPERSLQGAGAMKLGLHLPNAGNRGYDFSSRRHGREIRRDLSRIRRHRNRFRFEYAVFHPPQSDASPGAADFFIRNLREVGIPLVLENVRGYGPEAFWRYYRGAEAALGDALSGICLDIPHAHLTEGDWKSYYRLLCPLIRVIHLSDCAGGEDTHLPFGAGGELDLKSILAFLKRNGYPGIVNFEILPPSLAGVTLLFPMIRRIRGFLGDKDEGQAGAFAKAAFF
jgi:sugar phosphate isomerase/epimerase